MSWIERTKSDVYPFISPLDGMNGVAKGKTVLVTGAGGGIGKAIAKYFALAGASTVIISGRRSKPLEETKVEIEQNIPGCSVVAVPTDVADEKSVQNLFGGLKDTVPDVLVNNAGASGCPKNIVDSGVEEWWSDYEINVKGVYICSRAYLRALGGKRGVILNVSSAASISTTPAMSSYATAKTAVNRITEFIHMEHFKQGVQCIAFHPGGILDTGMGQNALEYFKPYLVDTVDLAAGTALYLSTPRAQYLAGRFVLSTWNMEQLEALKERILSEDLLRTRVNLGGEFLGTVVKNIES